MQNQLNTANSNLSTATSQLATANSSVSSLKGRVNSLVGFTQLSLDQQQVLEPVVETIIPSDSNGPGAKEAGVIYFIDRQLAGDYGLSGNMFMDAPHILPNIPMNTTTPLTVPPSAAWAALPTGVGGNGSIAALSYTGATRSFTVANPATTYNITYGITASPRVGSGINYQYPVNMREFWRVGLKALQAYSNTKYGGNFQTLSAANQLTCLQDLWANKPTPTADDLTGFSNLVPSDFAYELTFMTWAGFLMDPLYGGNQNMVGWTYVGYNGVNFGNFYNEGLSQKDLMVARTATRLKPASLAQYQNAANGTGA